MLGVASEGMWSSRTPCYGGERWRRSFAGRLGVGVSAGSLFGPYLCRSRHSLNCKWARSYLGPRWNGSFPRPRCAIGAQQGKQKTERKCVLYMSKLMCISSVLHTHITKIHDLNYAYGEGCCIYPKFIVAVTL